VPFRKEHYPPETLAMMYRVLDECVAEIVGGQAVDQIRQYAVCTNPSRCCGRRRAGP
jgi:hypothetical protein